MVLVIYSAALLVAAAVVFAQDVRYALVTLAFKVMVRWQLRQQRLARKRAGEPAAAEHVETPPPTRADKRAARYRKLSKVSRAQAQARARTGAHYARGRRRTQDRPQVRLVTKGRGAA